MKQLAKRTSKANQEQVLETGVDVGRRIVYLHGSISLSRVSRVIKHLRYLDSTPGEIILDIGSGGGEVQAGMALVDAVRFCANPVIGLVSSSCESIAFVILQACKYRAAYPWATISFHQGNRSSGSETNYNESLASAQYDMEQSNAIDQFVYERRNSVETLNDFQNRVLKSMYMSAITAWTRGWLDEVV